MKINVIIGKNSIRRWILAAGVGFTCIMMSVKGEYHDSKSETPQVRYMMGPNMNMNYMNSSLYGQSTYGYGYNYQGALPGYGRPGINRGSEGQFPKFRNTPVEDGSGYYGKGINSQMNQDSLEGVDNTFMIYNVGTKEKALLAFDNETIVIQRATKVAREIKAEILNNGILLIIDGETYIVSNCNLPNNKDAHKILFKKLFRDADLTIKIRLGSQSLLTMSKRPLSVFNYDLSHEGVEYKNLKFPIMDQSTEGVYFFYNGRGSASDVDLDADEKEYERIFKEQCIGKRTNEGHGGRDAKAREIPIQYQHKDSEREETQVYYQNMNPETGRAQIPYQDMSADKRRAQVPYRNINPGAEKKQGLYQGMNPRMGKVEIQCQSKDAERNEDLNQNTGNAKIKIDKANGEMLRIRAKLPILRYIKQNLMDKEPYGGYVIRLRYIKTYIPQLREKESKILGEEDKSLSMFTINTNKKKKENLILYYRELYKEEGYGELRDYDEFGRMYYQNEPGKIYSHKIVLNRCPYLALRCTEEYFKAITESLEGGIVFENIDGSDNEICIYKKYPRIVITSIGIETLSRISLRINVSEPGNIYLYTDTAHEYRYRGSMEETIDLVGEIVQNTAFKIVLEGFDLDDPHSAFTIKKNVFHEAKFYGSKYINVIRSKDDNTDEDKEAQKRIKNRINIDKIFPERQTIYGRNFYDSSIEVMINNVDRDMINIIDTAYNSLYRSHEMEPSLGFVYRRQ